jgi:predicted nucleic-acid-binding protein
MFHRNNYEAEISQELFRTMQKSNSHGFISTSAATDLFYIIHKNTHRLNHTYSIMENILKLVGILSVNEDDIYSTFSKKWGDFEDCVQYATAERNNIDFFVSTSETDFEDDTLSVISPEKCITILKNR